ncbi:hypothetical protein LSTR_LSTR007036 [Laodelphax striatellus]|uniref:Protein zwilch n=1 Tax=Laodelphax striatellus TaxID=195883 RepID=A0A482WJM3_LAOST|nr:hypothetical protein LSTR_LSTR007036 [Laodelphax striatellus]
MENLVIELQEFLKNSEDLDDDIILDSKKPKYLECFDTFDVDGDSSIILIRKEMKDDDSDDLNGSVSTRRSSVRESMSEFDLSGAPLKTDMNETLLAFNTSMIQKDTVDEHVPLSQIQARSILSYACLHLRPTNTLWVLMEPCGQHEMMIGCSVDNSIITRHMLQLRDGDTSVEEMLDIHRNCVSPNSKVDTEVMCDFTVNQLGTRDSAAHDYNVGKITIQVFWKEPSFKIPITNCSIKMDLHGTAGLQGSSVQFLWEQLELLHSYFELLSSWNDSQSYPHSEQQKSVMLPHKSSNTASGASLSEKITKTLNFSYDWYSGKNNEQTLSSVLEELKSGESHYADVTDRIWLILTECTTHLELVNNMAFLLQDVKKVSANTYMSADNHTWLGKAITAVKNDPTANPLLLCKPLQLLIEIGLLKLRRDYITIFTDTFLAKKESLEVPSPPSFTSLGGQSWSEAVSSCLCWMSKIHAALELMCVAHSNLLVKKATIVSLTRQILEKYVGPNSPVESFTWLKNNPNLYLSAKVDRQSSNIPQDPKYDKWMMKLTTTEGNQYVETKFLRTSDSMFPASVLYMNAKTDCFNNTTTCLENANYTFSQMISISTSMGKLL